MMQTHYGKRRLPQRKRSQSTVNLIFKATLALVEEDGYANLSTNRIAERAGVNIASLYRYFPNRQAIVIAMYEDVTSRMATRMKSALAGALHQSIDESMPALIRVLYNLYRENETVVLRLRHQVPELQDADRAYEIDRLIHGASRVYFEQRQPEIHFDDVETTLYFAANNILANIRDYIQEQPEHIPLNTFIKELSRSVIAYLKTER